MATARKKRPPKRAAPKKPAPARRVAKKAVRGATRGKAEATIDGYLAQQPPAVRALLQQVRRAIHAAVPGAEECISYSIPAFRVGGRVAIFFAGWRDHWSLYPVGPTVMERLGAALDGHHVSKGTLRFPLDQKPPLGLLAQFARARADEVLARR